MRPIFHSINERKADIILRTFVEAADEDYLTARWGHMNSMGQVFHWSSAQALEKLMKAVLLMNGVNIQDVGHDLNKAVGKIEHIFPNMFDEKISETLNLVFQDPEKIEMSLRDFIERIGEFGNPDIRYHGIDRSLNGTQLAFLDGCVYTLRLALVNNSVLADNFFERSNKAQLPEDGKEADPWMLDHDLRLEKLSWARNDNMQELRNVFLSENRFFVTGKCMRSRFSGYSFMGSPLIAQTTAHLRLSIMHEHIYEEPSLVEDEQLLEWVLSEICYSKKEKARIQFYFDKLRSVYRKMFNR